MSLIPTQSCAILIGDSSACLLTLSLPRVQAELTSDVRSRRPSPPSHSERLGLGRTGYPTQQYGPPACIREETMGDADSSSRTDAYVRQLDIVNR